MQEDLRITAIRNHIQERRIYLEKLIARKESAVNAAPEGMIKGNRRRCKNVERHGDPESGNRDNYPDTILDAAKMKQAANIDAKANAKSDARTNSKPNAKSAPSDINHRPYPSDVYRRPEAESWQYYYRKNQGDAWHYLRRNELSVAVKISQREYDIRIIAAAKEELRKLDMINRFYQARAVENVFAEIPASYRNLAKPVHEQPSELLDRWKTINFERMNFAEGAPEYYSQLGERMRSKSETMIADRLARRGIPYIYEKPLALKGFSKPIHPDFTLLDFRRGCEIYWEHLGMMDDHDYRDSAFAKINAYEQQNIFPGDRLIITFETAKQPLNTRTLNKILERLQDCRFVIPGDNSGDGEIREERKSGQ